MFTGRSVAFRPYFSGFEMVLAGVLSISSSVGPEVCKSFSGAVSRNNLILSELSAERVTARDGRRQSNTIRRQKHRSVSHTDVDRNRPSSPGFLVTQTFRISQMRECFSSVIASATLLLLLSLPTFAHGRIHESHQGRHHHRSIAHSAFGCMTRCPDTAQSPIHAHTMRMITSACLDRA